MSMPNKYGNKVVELKGIVKGLDRTSGEAEVLVISPGKEAEEVRCFVVAPDEPWAKLSKGQSVTVKGIVRRLQGNPMLVSCSFAATGPSLAINSTAEALAKELDADADQAETKFKNKSFVLTGEVDRVEKGTFSLTVFLKAPTKNSLACTFRSQKSTKERDAKLVPGAKIKFYGEFPRFGAKGPENCELITE
jgi:hypothetical protein